MVPSSYIHSLDCFVATKQEFLASGRPSSSALSTVYDYQHKYVTALIKQLPPGTFFPSSSKSVPVSPPNTIKSQPVRQGPFLLQPSPRNLEGSEGGHATDIVYLTFGADAEEGSEGETERLGVVLAVFQDGKVDVYLDVEKLEARWEIKQVRAHFRKSDSAGRVSTDFSAVQESKNDELPMLAVYETIDLGIVSSLSRITSAPKDRPILDLLQGSHPVFLLDPIHDDTIYVYHAFGVHTLNLGPLMRRLALALRTELDRESEDGSAALAGVLQDTSGTDVRPVLLTFSVERK